jgi:hypothetical protein
MQREMLVDEAQRNWVKKEVEGEVRTGNKDENNTHLIRNTTCRDAHNQAKQNLYMGDRQ